METNYYNRSNNFSAPVKKEPKPYVPVEQREEKTQTAEILHQNESDKVSENIKEIKNLKNDDILLLGVIFLLISDSKGDKLLLIALGYLFISSYIKR